MSRRTKIIIIIVLAVVAVILLAIVAFAPRPLIFGNRNAVATPTPVGGLPPSGGGPLTVPLPTPTVVTKEPSTQAQLEALSRTFAERYGSYSSQSGMENLDELSPLMTARMAGLAVAELQATIPPGEFFGVTTRALNVQIIALDAAETEAQIVVDTQRSENRGSIATRQFYQKLTIKIVKEKDGWKVDEAGW